MKKYKVVFRPEGQVIDVFEGSTVMKAIKEAGVDFDFLCGGGKCGKCRVRIVEGSIKTHVEEKAFLGEKETSEGIHLACFTEIYSDIVVELLQAKAAQHQILLEAGERPMEIIPHICKKYIEVRKPSLDNHLSDWKRFRSSLFQGESQYTTMLETEIAVLHQLSKALRANQYHLTAVTYGHEVLGIEEQDTTQKLMGMAFDIGTTSIVGYLMDLHSGRELGVVSTVNPQTKFGADVITRMNYANQEEKGLERLHDAVTQAISKLIGEAVEKAGLSSDDIYVVTVAGNTCMHHLFLGLDPQYLSRSPYTATTSEPLILNAVKFPITMNPAGKILVLPNIAGFVGADTVAVLLATQMDQSEEIKLMIDIGTNGEIALGSKHKLFACSSAAGPAFEGAQISSGMRGATGAIDHVVFEEKLAYSVIGGGKPQGICGSGLLDVVAGLIEHGIVDKRGRFLPIEKITSAKAEGFKENIVQYEGMAAFLLADENTTLHGRPILVTQKDIRELQLAKGAMAAGIKVLVDKHGIAVEDIKEVLLAGAFGNYLNPHSACVIGLIPKALEGKIKMVGNAAGTGARLALLSSGEYKRGAAIAEFTQYVELASYPNFSSIFAESMYF
ncbi:ASKHA domain-containing protein [Clostridium formicaceticum]|uniref:Ferredoxin n=1 Tax=Clostridium formicaceticum TaxID=1497 RepID=A0AAC9RS48_9CLOT|nr:ASKHA domain-containing protein [Clostridium formicaceticum]AOY74762.1 ferredoxin [Clostridium formicaceticum]ARE89150.1 Phenol hydroxylase P5 protein [Clostridium formicaceticum]